MIELKLPDVPVPDHLQVELSGAGCLDSQEPDVVRRVGSHSHGLEVEAVPDRGLGLNRLQRHDADLVSDPIVSASFSRFRPTAKKFRNLKNVPTLRDRLWARDKEMVFVVEYCMI